MDARVKTFRAEATARMSFLVEDLGFVGPVFDDHGVGYPVMMSLVYHRAPLHVEVALILAYAGEEYLHTSLIVNRADGRSDPSEIGTNMAHTAFQMRRAFDRRP
jgi:hypothetical protein